MDNCKVIVKDKELNINQEVEVKIVFSHKDMAKETLEELKTMKTFKHISTRYLIEGLIKAIEN